jgi:hypothetical protein
MLCKHVPWQKLRINPSAMHAETNKSKTGKPVLDAPDGDAKTAARPAQYPFGHVDVKQKTV